MGGWRRFGLFTLVMALGWAGCGRRGIPTEGLGGLHAALSATAADDLAAVRLDVARGGTIIVTRTVTPTMGGGGGSGPGGDAFFTLPPGLYAVTGTPLDASGAPSRSCSSAMASATVEAGLTAEVTLTIFCQSTGSGGLDVVIKTVHAPVITDLSFDPSKFTLTCEPVTVTVTAQDSDGDPLTYEWTVASQPAGAVDSLTPNGAKARFVGQTPGDYSLTVTVKNPQGQTASLTFPVHVLQGPLVECGGDPILGAFVQLEATVAGGSLTSLAGDAARARAAYEGGDPCGAVSALDALMADAQSARQTAGAAPLADDVFDQASGLRASVLALRAAAGGCASAPRFGAPPTVTVTASDATQLTIHVDFGEPVFTTRFGGGQTFSEVEVPGVEAFGGAPGTPAVPIFRRLFAVPIGAEPQLRFAKPSGGRTLGLNVVPIQPQPVDQAAPPSGAKFPKPDPSTFQSPPFAIDTVAYASQVAVPPGPCRVDVVGQQRDLRIAQLSCGAGQYVPAGDALTLFDGMDVGIAFTGGQGGFQTKRAATSPFEDNSPASSGALLNGPASAAYTVASPVTVFGCPGEELLILTPAAFQSSAIALATWKNSKGITTRVALVDNGSGGFLTNTDVQRLIDRDYDLCAVRPSYVLLLGDAGFIPPFYENGIGTDYPYAVYPRPTVGASLPDFAVARMPAATAAQADVMVNKVINYEKAPPKLADFYGNITIASYFQAQDTGALGMTYRDKRTFIHVSEQMRNGLRGVGYDVERIYTRDFGAGLDTPSQFDDGTALPPDLGPASGFPWSGNTTDIVNAYEAGRVLIFHRDHGWPDGWAAPAFDTGDAGALTNGDLLPVVFSVNCASGYFDDETDPFSLTNGTDDPHFVETLLRNPMGGAVGAIGDTRNSPSWENSILARGYFDAVYPTILPAYGPATSHPRLADIVNYGKVYLISQEGAFNGAVMDEVNPTQEIWTSNPNATSIPLIPIYVLVNTFPPQPIPGPDPGPYIEISYPVDGAVLTAYQQTSSGPIPIARGTASNGVVQLVGVQNVDPTLPLQVSASLPGAVSQPLRQQ